MLHMVRGGPALASDVLEAVVQLPTNLLRIEAKITKLLQKDEASVVAAAREAPDNEGIPNGSLLQRTRGISAL